MAWLVLHNHHILAAFGAKTDSFFFLGVGAPVADYAIGFEDARFCAEIALTRQSQALVFMVVNSPLDLFHAPLAEVVHRCGQNLLGLFALKVVFERVRVGVALPSFPGDVALLI